MTDWVTLGPMAYDEGLAERVRELLRAEGSLEEKKMFGGLGFLLAGHMPVCLSGQGGLLVRVAEADGEELVAAGEHAEWMTMGGRTARTWLHVAAPALTSDDDLAAWVERGLGVVRGLPPKS